MTYKEALRLSYVKWKLLVDNKYLSVYEVIGKKEFKGITNGCGLCYFHNVQCSKCILGENDTPSGEVYCSKARSDYGYVIWAQENSDWGVSNFHAKNILHDIEKEIKAKGYDDILQT